MRKLLVLAFLAVSLIISGVVVYAETEEVPEWFNEMIEWRKAQVSESLEAGDLTQDQADAWIQHFDDMKEFHEEVGFEGMGGCRRGQGFAGRGFGPGRGNGFGWNQQ